MPLIVVLDPHASTLSAHMRPDNHTYHLELSQYVSYVVTSTQQPEQA